MEKVSQSKIVSSNGQSKVLNSKRIPETESLDLETLQRQFAEMGQVLNTLKAQQESQTEREMPRYDSNTNGRRKAIWFIVGLSVVFGVLYNAILVNEWSLKPIDLAAIQKLIFSSLVFFVLLLVVERGLKFFAPAIHWFFVNDNGSSEADETQDFSHAFLTLQPWHKVIITFGFIALFCWVFVSLLSVKWS
ncbi:MAG: hypothetical protein U0Y10_04600 [Spirosomataceae bacterium]